MKISILGQEYEFKMTDLNETYHELIHAYCKESGASFDEDQVNWIAFMIPKIVKSANEILEKLDAQSKD